MTFPSAAPVLGCERGDVSGRVVEQRVEDIAEMGLGVYVLQHCNIATCSCRRLCGRGRDPDAAYELLRYQLLRLGAHHAAEVPVVGDGAVWVWNRADELRKELGLPRDRFHETVEYFHAAERLSDLSKSRTGWPEVSRRAWMSVQKTRLKAGEIEQIEEVFHALVKREPEAMAKEIGYRFAEPRAPPLRRVPTPWLAQWQGPGRVVRTQRRQHAHEGHQRRVDRRTRRRSPPPARSRQEWSLERG